MSQSPADHCQEVADIRPLATIFIFLSWCLLIQGCSSSDETSRDTRNQEQHNDTHKTDPPPPSQVVRSAVAPSAQQFKVRADTVTAQPKKKGGPQNSTSIEVRQTPSKTYFAVQIGAFKSKRNVENNEKILTERFHKPVTFRPRNRRLPF